MAAFRVMKYAVLILFIAFSPAILAQTPKTKPTQVRKAGAAKAKPNPTPTPVPLSEKEQFDKASKHELAVDRVAALDKFLVDFPQSENRPAAAELLASSRILIAEEMVLSNKAAEAVAIYKKVINDYPGPFPAELYTDSISKIPQTLFFRGQRAAAVELATLIEGKVESDAGRLLEIANFYLRIENGNEAMRVAAKAAAKDPSSGAVYRTIALAHRINFDLELSADSYAKSLELDPDSVTAKRGLAEMKRALGKSDEAVILYRDLLSKNASDVQSSNGLILALFESNKRAEAEAELAKSLEKAPNNFSLMAGAAYWYASRGAGDRAVDLAQKALNIEPRYIWSHIALARGLIKQGKPVAAEQVLIRARAHATFPTLEYELASARMEAGFFREAVDDLAKHFSLTDDGVKTRLGGRIARTEKNLAELAAAERRASIFAHDGPDTADDAERLRGLLLFDEELQESEPRAESLEKAADVFTGGTDKMRFHRQIYAASEMLKRRVALPKVLELTNAATGNSDAALEVSDPVAAVMADELYDARQAAFRKNDFLLVPDVPRAKISAILRERIEEIAGWALYQQGSFADATVRLRRAVNVAPTKSAWWRSSMWRLGAALSADGKDAEALNAYIESYKDDKPDFAKYAIVETLYRKINGSVDGLEAKIGRERVVASSGMATPEPVSTPSPTIESPTTNVTTDNPSTQVSPPAISIDRTRNLFRPMPAGVPVATDLSSSASRIAASGANKIDAVPAATPSIEVKKDPPTDPPATEVKKEEPPPVEVKKEEPPPIEVKKEEPAVAQPTVETKRDEPAASPSITEQKKDEPAAAELKKEDPQPVTTKKPDEPTATPPVEQKKDEPAPEQKAEQKVEVVKTDSQSLRVDDAKAAARKPLFEPIIITIPRPKPATTENKLKTDDETAKKPDDQESSVAGNARPRLIDGQEVKVDSIPPCTINVSQERLTLINNGLSVGLLVGFEGPGEIRTLTAASSSPKDLQVTLEPEISGMPDRRFFVIKSLSTLTGAFQVTFTMPCGTKDILVTVR